MNHESSRVFKSCDVLMRWIAIGWWLCIAHHADYRYLRNGEGHVYETRRSECRNVIYKTRETEKNLPGFDTWCKRLIASILGYLPSSDYWESFDLIPSYIDAIIGIFLSSTTCIFLPRNNGIKPSVLYTLIWLRNTFMIRLKNTELYCIVERPFLKYPQSRA